jgi:mRNA interferase MazF
MTNCDRGDVVLVPFPFTDLSDVKRRPALVVSTAEYNRATGDVVIAQITSRVGSPTRPGDHQVEKWREAGLLRPSLVRARLTTLENGLLIRILGKMPAGEMELIDKALASALGF